MTSAVSEICIKNHLKDHRTVCFLGAMRRMDTYVDSQVATCRDPS